MIELFVLGIILGLIMDVVWWNKSLDKYEKGFEALEHYHFGILAGIVGLFIYPEIFFGLMLALFISEWTQTHQFAYQSNHFKSSTLIGIVMFICFGLLYYVYETTEILRPIF